MKRYFKRFFFCLGLMICFLPVSVCGAEQAGSPLVGEWAFNHNPEETVLLVREDGTAGYEGRSFLWEDDGEFLLLTEDGTGETVSLRYSAEEEKVLLYLPQVYVRVEDIPGEGLIGAWIGQETEGSTFIFREDHRFLEDGTFTGTFRIETDESDPATGTFLLVYPQYFDDTLCYFRLEGNNLLTVEYPWPLVERQAAPSL